LPRAPIHFPFLGNIFKAVGPRQGLPLSKILPRQPLEIDWQKFRATILADTEESIWNQQMDNYAEEPYTCAFTDLCLQPAEMLSSATGPFYCPGDESCTSI